MKAKFSDKIKSRALYFLPHHAISRVVYKLTRIETVLAPPIIKTFIKIYNVNIDEAKITNLKEYSSFNNFFTRELKESSRTLDNTDLVSPVDGTISEFGDIHEGQLLQAKGINYSLASLLGSDADAEPFKDGQFMTIYLSPRDYHRIHMPCLGQLTQQLHIPGRLFSVAQHTVNTVKGIFTRNERVIAHFDTHYGKLAMVLVGAINVAAIETIWDGLVTPPKGKSLSIKRYEGEESIRIAKGDEMGRFNMGSTVILVMEKDFPKLADNLSKNQSIQLGNTIS